MVVLGRGMLRVVGGELEIVFLLLSSPSQETGPRGRVSSFYSPFLGGISSSCLIFLMGKGWCLHGALASPMLDFDTGISFFLYGDGGGRRRSAH